MHIADARCNAFFMSIAWMFFCVAWMYDAAQNSSWRSASPSAEAMLQMPEYRIMLCSNSDGLPYTEQEFIEFFGPGRHLNHWSSSMPVHILHRNGPRCRWMCLLGSMVTATVSDSEEYLSHKREGTSVVAKRKFNNGKLSVRTCSITNALSGNEIVTFQTMLPYLFIPAHFHQRLCLDAARVARADGTTSMLNSFTFTSETKDVRVVLCGMLPRDVWKAKRKPGWRKWYKEFRVFAENAFPTDTFKETPLRELVPLILQAFVDDERKRLGDRNGVLPTRSRGWDGAYHSIVFRTEKRATLKEVRAWVADWLVANEEVLGSITGVVEFAPCCQYFA